MSWWGKVLGGAFGFMLGGPLGAAFGAAVGHHFDRGLGQHRGVTPFGSTRPDQERIQAAFFTATFSVMGHVAKADGRVSEDEIALARDIMQQMALNAEQIRVARELFNQGKHPGFDLDAVIEQFRNECRRRNSLLQVFLEIQLHAAYADGELDPREERILRRIASALGFGEHHFMQLEALVRAQRFVGAQRRRQPPHDSGAMGLSDAYAILGVSASSSDAEVTKAYRRLMNQHHPDKLVARGLPEEMIKVATARTQEIKRAHDTVKTARATRH